MVFTTEHPWCAAHQTNHEYGPDCRPTNAPQSAEGEAAPKVGPDCYWIPQYIAGSREVVELCERHMVYRGQHKALPSADSPPAEVDDAPYVNPGDSTSDSMSTEPQQPKTDALTQIFADDPWFLTDYPKEVEAIRQLIRTERVSELEAVIKTYREATGIGTDLYIEYLQLRIEQLKGENR